MKIRGDKEERKIAEIKGCLSQVQVHIRVWQDFRDLWDIILTHVIFFFDRHFCKLEIPFLHWIWDVGFVLCNITLSLLRLPML